jgi:hypothetical protein
VRFAKSLRYVDCDNTVGLTRVDIVILRVLRVLACLHIPSRWWSNFSVTVVNGRSVSAAEISESAWYRLVGRQSQFVIYV